MTIPVVSQEPNHGVVITTDQITPQGVLKAILRRLYRDKNFTVISQGAHELFDENAQPGKLRLSDIDDQDLLQLIAAAGAASNDREVVLRALLRELHVSEWDAGVWYRIALFYKAEGHPLTASYLFRQCTQQVLNEGAKRVASEEVKALPPLDWRDRTTGRELGDFAQTFDPLVRAFSEDVSAASDHYHIFLEGPALDEFMAVLHAAAINRSHAILENDLERTNMQHLRTILDASVQASSSVDSGDLNAKTDLNKARIAWNEAIKLASIGVDFRPRAIASDRLAHLKRIDDRTLGDLLEAVAAMTQMGNADSVQELLVRFDDRLRSAPPREDVSIPASRLLQLMLPPIPTTRLAKDPLIHLERATDFDEQGKSLQAVIEYRRTLLINPKEVRAYQNLALLLLTQAARGKEPQLSRLAHILLTAATIIDPAYRPARQALATLFSSGATVSEDLRNADAQEHFNRAEEAFARAEFQVSIREYQAAIRLEPTFAKAHLYLGDSYFRLGEYDSAIKSYEAALRLNPQDNQAQRFLLDAYVKAGISKLTLTDKPTSSDLVRETAAIRQAATLTPSAQNNYKLGMLYLSRQLYTPARYYFWQAVGSAGQDTRLVLASLHGLAYTSIENIKDEGARAVTLFYFEDQRFRLAFDLDRDKALEQYGFILPAEVKSTVLKTDFRVLRRLCDRFESQPLPSAEMPAPDGYRTHIEASRSAFTAHDLDQALDHAITAIHIYPDGAAAYALAGRNLFALEQHLTAAMYFEEALLHGYPDHDLHLWIGLAHYLMGDSEAAGTAFRKAAQAGSTTLSAADYRALETPTQASKTDTAATTTTSRSPTDHKSSPDASISLDQLAKITAQIDDLVREGDQLLAQKDYGSAHLRYSHALRVAAEINDEARRAMIQDKLTSLNTAHRIVISAQQFIEEFPGLQPIARARTFDDKLAIIKALSSDERRHIAPLFSLAEFYFEKERNLDSALLYAQLELENARLVDSGPPPDDEPVRPMLLGRAEFALGDVYIRMGKYVTARDHLLNAEKDYIEAEKQRKQLGLAVDDFTRLFERRSVLAWVYERLAAVYNQLGEEETAQKYAQKAEAEDMASSAKAASVEQYLEDGTAYARHGLFEAAFVSLNRAVMATAQMNFIERDIHMPGILNELGLACNDLGLSLTALEFLNQAVKLDLHKDRNFEVSASGRPPINLVYDFRNIGQVYETTGVLDKAEDSYRKAMQYALRGVTDDSHATLRADLTIDPSATWPVLERLGAVLERRARAAADPPRRQILLEEALNRSRQAIEVFETTRRQLGGPTPQIAEEVKLGYTKQKVGVYHQAVSIVEELSSGRNDRASAQLALQYAERSKSQILVELLNERDLRPPAGVNLTPIDEALNQLAAENVLVLEYYFLNDAILVWCFGGHGRIWTATQLERSGEKIDPAKLQIEVLNYIEALSSPLTALDDIKRQGEYLYETLIPEEIRTIIDSHRSDALVVVPHDFLHLLPFHALYRSGAALADNYQISYAPSLELLLNTLRARKTQAATPPLLFSILNPSENEELSSARQQRSLPILFPSPPSTHYIGGKDHEGADQHPSLRELASYDFVHIFTHGEFDPTHPLDSYVALGSRRLTAADIYEAAAGTTGIRLRARLITLAACETGRGDVMIGDEVLGLPRAFIYAGATALITSLWRANEDFTDSLMVHLYQRLASGTPNGVALREALRETIAIDSDFQHPAYWAPFVLIGDPR